MILPQNHSRGFIVDHRRFVAAWHLEVSATLTLNEAIVEVGANDARSPVPATFPSCFDDLQLLYWRFQYDVKELLSPLCRLSLKYIGYIPGTLPYFHPIPVAYPLRIYKYVFIYIYYTYILDHYNYS